MAEPPKQGRRLTVLSDAAGVDPGTPLQAPFEAPALRRFSTPDCMSSPVSYLRDMTHGLEAVSYTHLTLPTILHV